MPSRFESGTHNERPPHVEDVMRLVEAPYPAVASMRVAEAMHRGLISCAPSTSLLTVARMMATNRVHAILVRDLQAARSAAPWRVISDTDLMKAAAEAPLDEQLAGTAETTPAPTVCESDALAGAVKLLLTLGLSHLVVIERWTSKPIGVLSTLDVCRALAGFPERHPARF